MIGDINIDLLKQTPEGSLLNELLLSYNMERLPLPPTRVTQNTRSSIDAVCVDSGNIQNMDVEILNTGISDHTGQLCKLNLPVRKKTSSLSVRRHLNNRSLNNLKHCLAEENWDTVFKTEDANEAYNNFLSIITAALDKVCPLKKSRINNNFKTIPLCDAEARALKQQFLEAEEKFIMSGKEEDKQTATQHKRTYDNKLKSIRRNFSAQHINNSTNKSKAIWNTINNERHLKKTKSAGNLDHLKISGNIVEDPTLISNYFNEHLATIAEKTLNKGPSRSSGGPSPATQNTPLYIQSPLLVLKPTSPKELSDVLNGLKVKPSAGLDEISSSIVKVCKSELLLPLVHVTNLSLQSGEFPKKMKFAKVIPLHKNGSKQSVENYRPI
ncbi:uncharacterized protein LOC124372602 [Homalodisca vitripennis]|uniref:uncharacterized protein LOC124372602 n=1 Tax=Homalodisca vitripennis TaxID=197043 RepID=UPI001EECC921|nr:uncharacterized protein LOC124372602 [Homalodisca vitripennis]